MMSDTTETRRRRILDAFDAALDMEEAAREAYLTGQFGDDAEAIQSVRALIAADAVAPSAMPTELPGEGERTLLIAPSRIGPYKLENLIGSGGMGEVWRGVRDDGLFDQEVAVKLMRPSRYATEALAFFDTERRALARLSHPHIARLIDGGVTENGLPWFLMDLIDGLPLHVYAAGRRLERDAILRLMVMIANAVQHAHSQLVVHADLKPSNILITPDGEPRLVDFGIASLAATAAEQAETIAFPSTPAYASPQRLKGEAPAVTDDIYSLGLLLHGLLTGEWPEKPLGAPLKSTIDLACDAIIAKACAAGPAERYATAQAFGDDLQAVLDHQPTSLQKGDVGAETRLFVRRHPRAVIAAAGGVVATITVLILITGLYLHAAHERARAQQRFNDVRALAGYMLSDFHDELVKLPGSTALRERNATLGWQYLERLSKDDDATVDVTRDIAVGYGRLGNAQATTSSNGSGKVKQGDWALKESERLLRDLVKKHPERDDFKRELARTLSWRAGVILGTYNDEKGAVAAITESVALYDEVLKRNPGDLDAAYGRWNTANGLADIYFTNDDLAGRKKLMEETLNRFRDTAVTAKYRSLHDLLEAATVNNLGDTDYYLINPQAGIARYKRAWAIMDKARADGVIDMRIPMRQAYYAYQLSSSYDDIGQPKPALEWADRGVAIASELNRFDDSAASTHVRDILSLHRARVLASMGRSAEAIAEAESTIARRRVKLAAQPENFDNHINLVSGLHSLQTFYADAGRKDKACATAREALAKLDQIAGMGGVPERNQRMDAVPLKEFIKTCPKI